ncbi:hsp90 co-chaperone Cdc37 [Trichomonascus vanleenenianus]|uniref:Hsp90 co-chaperone CDC37 n=1 Tax=Trichomonascus vanleenenianus TaxID=2268995 RepID=UPI003ECAF07D
MVIDYSKWDKLELSDDSDVEVHPNVDKQSFIRWKQRDIHEKRERLKHNIQQLEVSVEMNSDLVKRTDQMIECAEKGEDVTSIESAVKISERGFEDKKHPISETNIAEAPEYNDMIESLMEKILGEIGEAGDKQQAVIAKLKEHRTKLAGIVEDQKKQLEEFRRERATHLTSEDLRTGFDTTIINKPTADSSKPSKGKEVKQEIEVLNPGASSSKQQPPKEQPPKEEEDVDDIRASATGKKFAEIPMNDYAQLYNFLGQHPEIVTEREKDALLMEAFQHQLDGKTDLMKQTVHNALLIQYCHTLGPDGLRMFFSKIAQKDHPARDAFLRDVETTTQHITTRCAVIASERAAEAGEAVEQIQLHAVDPNTQITVTVPDTSDPEKRKLYESFSPEMRKAIESASLDEINKVLGEMTVEDAEEAVRQFDECGVLQVEEKIYDASEWQKDKLAHGAPGDVEDFIRENNLDQTD